MLATLLRGAFAPECYVPPNGTIELREIVRYRTSPVRERTRLKNQVHAYLLTNNILIGASPFVKNFFEELSVDSPTLGARKGGELIGMTTTNSA